MARGIAGIFLIAVASFFADRCCFALPSFSSGIQTGTIQNSSITEASGIAASRVNANVLWTHNDSGNPAQVFPMTSAGTNLGTYSVSGASNIDWEDIAVGPGPSAGAQYLYIGDIGDNNAVRSNISIYRVPEPAVSDTQSPVTTSISGATKFTFTYPGGARDAESLFVDPLTKDLYIISKRENPHNLYRAAYSQPTDSYAALAQMAAYTDTDWLTGADISPDGNELIVRGGSTASGLMFLRPPGGSITDAFISTPIAIPLHSETQGEAIGFDPNGRGYFTTSEGSSQPIYYFDLVPPPAGSVYWDNDGAAAGSYVATGAGMGGTGTWNTSALKWYNGSADVPWVNGNDAVFWGTAGTVTLAAAQSVNSLTFKSTGYTITASTLTLSGSSVTVDANVTATIGSIVAGTAGLVKNGAGTLFLTNTSNQTSGYTGGTTINAGTLNIASGTVSRSGGAVTINNAATLQFTGNFTLAAARSVTLGPGGAVIDTHGNDDTIAGAIGGTALIKTGAGTLSLTNDNIYTGGTFVSAGTLLVLNTTGSGTGTGQMSVSSGATLGGTGTVQGNVTNSGTLAPGNSAGTLHLGGTYTQTAGGRLEIELASTSSHDELAISGSASLAGTLAVSLLGGFTPQEGDVFEIMSASTFFGTTFTSTTLPALSGSLVWNIDYGANLVTLSVTLPGDFNGDGVVDAADYVVWRKGLGTTFTPGDYDTWRTHLGQTASPGAGVVFVAVPEPEAWLMVGSGVVIALVRGRSWCRVSHSPCCG
jgi:autotransporter-associated beta strand protein